MKTDLSDLRHRWERAVFAHLQNPEDAGLKLRSVAAWRDYWAAAKWGAVSTKRADLCVVDHNHERGCKEMP